MMSDDFPKGKQQSESLHLALREITFSAVNLDDAPSRASVQQSMDGSYCS